MQYMIEISDEWKRVYPGACAGFLVMTGAPNMERHPGLGQAKSTLEEELRMRYRDADRKSLDSLPQIQPYVDFYKRFDKTYHVRLQLESIVFKAKPIPSVSTLVEAMFMAELKNGLLTAGHDMDVVNVPIRVGVARGGETMVQFNGKEQVLKQGDMFMSDGKGILSSVIYGPDSRAQIQPDSTNVIYTVYAPDGISPEALHTHLEDIRAYVLIAHPHAVTGYLEIHP